MSLQSSRKGNPEVKIVMDFYKLQFDDGMKQVGTLKSNKKGLEKYTINRYSDLDAFLGCKWFIRGINSNGDFYHVMLKTVSTCLQNRLLLILP